MQAKLIQEGCCYEPKAMKGSIYFVRQVTRPINPNSGTVKYYVEESPGHAEMVGKECEVTLSDFAERMHRRVASLCP